MLALPRPLVRLLTLLVAVAGLLAAPFGQAQALGEADGTILAELLAHSNAARAREGLDALAVDTNLAAAAAAHAREMAELEFFDHTSPVAANATLGLRVSNARSPLVEVGENLARMTGVPDSLVASRTVQGWLDSPGHRLNLLNPSFNRVGFGVHRDPSFGLLVVQVLGWEPYSLSAGSIGAAVNTTTSMVLRFDSRSAIEVVLSFGGGPGVPTPLPAGISDVVLVPLSQDSELAIGVRQGRSFLYDEGATLLAGPLLASANARDPVRAGGTFRLDAGAPRRHTRLVGAFAVHQTHDVVRVELAYHDARAGALLVLFDSMSFAHAEVAPGRFELELTHEAVERAGTGGQAEILVGIPVGGGSVRVFHRFAVVPTQLR